VRASDLSGAVILAQSACPPGARLPALCASTRVMMWATPLDEADVLEA
jgi:hypothetical protein